MGPILIVLWLLLVPLGVGAGGFVAAIALGYAFSTGEDGDPPQHAADLTSH
jgi:hypothetical protein